MLRSILGRTQQGNCEVIIWGSGNGNADLGVAEHRACATCERERPFKVLLQYKYAHLYYLRWVTKKAYYLACEVCHRGAELDARAVEAKLQKHPIPFMTRYGWTFLVAIPAMFVLSAAMFSVIGVARLKAGEAMKSSAAVETAESATKSAAVDGSSGKGGVRTPLKEAFEIARLGGNIEMVLPTLRKAELYVIVDLDPADGNREKLLTVPSPKEGRMAVTAAESLDTLKSVSRPKRKMTGAQLLAELTPDTELVIAYPDGADYLTREHLAWLKSQQ